ncbi:MAG: HAD-IA family hydrolase [Hyphomicrobiales bacterium]
MSLSNTPHLVIFDCDGTLVDGQHLVIASMNEAFKRHGLEEPDERATRRVIGLSLKIAVAKVLGSEQEHHADEVTETFKQAFHDLRANKTVGEPFYDGALELVDALSKRDDVLLGIATGKSRRGVDIMLERTGWHDTFISIQTADSAPSKPHPGMILNALSDSGALIENTIMVGDTTFDMEMARAANAKAFGVAWGYHDVKSLAAAGAHMIVDDYAALESALNATFMDELL